MENIFLIIFKKNLIDAAQYKFHNYKKVYYSKTELMFFLISL